MNKLSPISLRAFSLLELLIVIAVLAMLVGVALPAFSNMSRETALMRTGQELSSALILSRDEALTKSRKVSVRLIKLPDPAGGVERYRAMQAWVVKDDLGTLAPLGKVFTFPPQIVISESPALSPLLQAAAAQGGSMTVAGNTRNYVSFTLLATGAMDRTITDQTSFLTLVKERDMSGAEPANFYAIYINPVTGEVSTFRP